MIHTFVNTIYVFLGDPMFNSEEEDVAVVLEPGWWFPRLNDH
jgi:hypothetical protein